MRQALFGAAVGAILVVVSGLFGGQGQAFAQRAAGFENTPELITLASPAGEGRQQLAVIDPRMQVLSVYHIDLTSGQVTLKSVRNFHWDLQMVEFNGISPLPQEIRSLLDSR